jgi:hypothetical protein
MRWLRPATPDTRSHSRSYTRRPLLSVAATATLAGLVTVAAPVATATGTVPTKPAAAALPYVALGDSYVSGPLIPTQLWDANDPIGCLRSSVNYPHDVAATLGLTLSDMSCAGATTSNMTNPQNVAVDTNPPQFSTITSATRVVTMSIGGNDIGFSSIVENCTAESPTGPTAVGPDCSGYYDANGVDQISQRIVALAPTIASLIQQIHTLAPKAKVFLVSYPDIIPVKGTGCWPSLPFEAPDVVYLRAKEVQLNNMIKAEAAANHAYYINTYAASVGHDACSPAATRWVEPIYFPQSPAAPIHPNATGMAGEAAVIVAAMRKHGIT